MARRTPKRKDETVEVFYGINPKTFEVQSVYLTRGGELSTMNTSGISGTHFVMPGRNARLEIIIVWGLSNLISFPPALIDGEFAKQQIAELHEKAAAMKLEAEQKKETD